MPITVADLIANLSADTTGFGRELKSATDQLGKLEHAADSADEQLSLFAVTDKEVGQQLSLFTKEAMQAKAQTADFGKQTQVAAGASADFMQTLAKLSDDALGTNFVGKLAEADKLLGTFGLSVSTLAKVAIGAVFVGALIQATKALTEFALEAGKVAEELDIVRAQTGLTTEQIQGLDVLLRRVALTPQDLALGFRTLSQKMREAQDDTSEAARTFRNLGIDVTTLRDKPYQALRAVAEATSQINNSFDRSATLTELFGRAAQRLNPALEEGAAAIDAAAAASKRMGEISQAQIAPLKALDDAFDDLGIATDRLKIALGSVFAPVVTPVITAITTAFSALTREVLILGAALRADAAIAAEFWEVMTRQSSVTGLEDRIRAISNELTAEVAAIEKGVTDTDTARKEGGKALERDTAKMLETLRKRLDIQKQAAFEEAAFQANFQKARTGTAETLISQQLAQELISARQAHEARLEAIRENGATEAAQVKAQQSALAKAHAEIMPKLVPSEQVTEQATFNVAMKKLADDLVLINQKKGLAILKENETFSTEKFKTEKELAEMERALNVFMTGWEIEQARKRLEAGAAVRDAEVELLKAKGASVEAIQEAERAALQAHERAKLAVTTLSDGQRLAVKTKTEADIVLVNKRAAEQILSDEIQLAHARAEAMQVSFGTIQDISRFRREAFELEMEKELRAAEGNETKRLAIVTRYTALINQQRRLETGGFIEGFRQGFQEYLTNAQNVFNVGVDFARNTFAGMANGFQTLFLDIMNGKIQTFQELLQASFDFVKTIFAQVAAQLVAGWIATTILQETQLGQQILAHVAAEGAKTAATTAGETSRLAISSVTNKVMLAGVISTIVAIGAVGNAAIQAMITAGQLAAAVLAAIGASLTATIVGAPLGALFLKAAAVASSATAIAGGIALAAFNVALGTAIVTASAALATPLAAGGIATRPTLALIGEAGPEAVIPLSQMRSGGPTSQTIVLNLDSRELARVVLPALHDEVRLYLGARA